MNNGLSFRQAKTSDYKAVLDLACQLATHIEAEMPPLTIEQFETYYIGPLAPMHLLLALKAEQIVGMISWTVTHELYSADARIYISDLAVHQVARSQGIGTALISQVKTWAHAHRIPKIAWEVWHRNASAKLFMRNLGHGSIKRLFPMS